MPEPTKSAKDSEGNVDDDNVTTAEAPMTREPVAARTYETEVDTTVEDENKAETKAQIETAESDDFTEDPGQLSEDLQGDYQRRVQMGVNPNELAYDEDDEDDEDEEVEPKSKKK